MTVIAVAARTQAEANKRLRLSRREGRNEGSSHSDNGSSNSIAQVDANERPSRREGGPACANEGEQEQGPGLAEAWASVHEQGAGMREGGYTRECRHKWGKGDGVCSTRFFFPFNILLLFASLLILFSFVLYFFCC
jgi:hypothetical protein